ncbi:hypothetical protein [Cellulomonas shaoxiangyii]|uniref:Uncharacterized protein n=1 Tax=Cellulomonas shaoxiangyii TaxID=2566013 RepID=A0A4P7SLZ4_9CELL|nr:hypothetical protein [Cellulomonas shaoxiangyii]QCB94981.1 hypothetical protein E5225_16835 [Cellulomonas shaoxiangyii]TGY77251.1 hypothetical protein E5226_17235 [Cellulomonas shaoxiangyii]
MSALRPSAADVRLGAVVTLLGSWFLASVVKQEPTRRLKALDKLDGWGIVLPEWRFFAPNPGVHDTHLLYRDQLADGSLTPWKECFPAEQRRVSQILWHPDRRAEKVVMDAIGEIIRVLDSKVLQKKEDLQVTITYLVLLNYATHGREHPPGARRTQFLIARSTGHEESDAPLLLFLSNLHPLP